MAIVKLSIKTGHWLLMNYRMSFSAAFIFALFFQIFLAVSSYAQSAPTITGFSDSSGVNDTEIIIYGTNFSTTPGNTTVAFYRTYGGICQCDPGTVISATPTALTVRVGNLAATGPIKVTVGTQSVTSSNNFTIVSGVAPTCTSAGPQISPVPYPSATLRFFAYGVHNAAGVSFTTIWSGYPEVSEYVDGTYAGNSTWYADFDLTQLHYSTTQLYGLFSTQVQPYGSSVTNCGSSNFPWTRGLPPPTVTSISQNVGAVGDQVTMFGTNFDPTPESNRVGFFFDVTSTVLSTGLPQFGGGAGSVTFNVPSGASSGPIHIKVAGQTATGSDVFYVVNSISLTVTGPVTPEGAINSTAPTTLTAQTIPNTAANLPVSTNCYSNLPGVNVSISPTSVVNTDSHGKAVFTLTSPTLVGFDANTGDIPSVQCFFSVSSGVSSFVNFNAVNACALPLSPLPPQCGNPAP